MEAVFLKLLNLSVRAGWLTLAVAAIRPLLGRAGAPRFVSCLMWGLVAVRLVCPVCVESSVSLLPVRETAVLETAEPSAPAGEAGGITLHTVVGAVDETAAPAVSRIITPEQEGEAGDGPDLVGAATAVWLAGLGVMAAYFLLSTLALSRRVSGARHVEGRIWETGSVPSPFAFGFLRPRVYLPAGLEPELRPYVTAHELAHIRRGDHIVKPAAFLLLSVYWFNPAMWLAYVLLCRDIELACDERVLRNLGAGAKKAYSGALLSAASPGPRVSACPVAFGEGRLRDRVKNVLRWKKPVLWLTAASLAAVAALGICFLTDPRGADMEDLAGSYRYEGDTGYDGDFLLRLMEDGTFSCSTVPLSGYIGIGDWEVRGGTVTLRDRGSSAERVIHLRVTRDGLAYASDGSDGFFGLDAAEGSLFTPTRLLPAPAGHYVRDSDDPLWGNFTIDLYSDGTFEYYEGFAASTFGEGTWTYDRDLVTLHDSRYNVNAESIEVVNVLRLTEEGLEFCPELSHGFIYTRLLPEGTMFFREGNAIGGGKHGFFTVQDSDLMVQVTHITSVLHEPEYDVYICLPGAGVAAVEPAMEGGEARYAYVMTDGGTVEITGDTGWLEITEELGSIRELETGRDVLKFEMYDPEVHGGLIK